MALHYVPKFCLAGDPYVGITFTKRTSKIVEKVYDAAWKPIGEKVAFYQQDIEAPDFWSDTAVQITAQKYFRGKLNDDGTPGKGRETSVRQIVDRVVDTIAGWAGYASDTSPSDDEPFSCMDCYESQRPRYRYYKRTEDCDLTPTQVYFDSKASWLSWKNDLKWLLIRQYMWFNSPVWFNVGVDDRPQCSACFILRVNDQMSSGAKTGDFNLDDHGLLAWQVKEGLIFASGSGAGVNLSRIRSRREYMSGHGRPTGPASFARGPDSWAGTIKSGGKTRRAAKMVILDLDHPDVEEFIRLKAEEEKIAKTLIAAGYPSDMDGVAYQHAFHQNANLTVRANDAFFYKVQEDAPWSFVSRTSHHLEDKLDAWTMLGTKGKVLESKPARQLAEMIADQCWQSGDPGMQYLDTIQDWHTCADEQPIFASNPCSEYLFLDETSCNLASLNLRRWFKTAADLADESRINDYQAGINALTIAMDVIVSGARYPTANIRKQSQRYRTLGVGYANLGGLLLANGIPYSSNAALDICESLTSLMTAQVYHTGVEIARSLGSFDGFDMNQDSFTRVMRKHRDASREVTKLHGLSTSFIHPYTDLLKKRAVGLWEDVADAAQNGLARNAQASVLAPTGTIAFSMDAETTGIEPELSLIKYKQLSGGGNIKIVNPLIPDALRALGYSDPELVAEQILAAGGAVRKVPTISPEHYAVFETSNPPAGDPDFHIPWRAHVEMMAVAQQFISGAISKTINMPNSATREDIWQAYELGWKLGLKAVAIYRDGSKGTQPLSTTEQKLNQDKSQVPAAAFHFDRPVTSVVLPDTEKILEDWSKERTVLLDQVAKLTESLAQRTRIQRMKPPREYHDLSRVKFEIGGHEGYLFVGFYPGTHDPCEAFVEFSKPGSTVQGIMNAWMISISIMLQVGYPFEDILRKFEHIDFEPKGFTGDDDVKIARSVVDFVVRKIQGLSQRRGPNTLAINEPETTQSKPVFGEDLLEEAPAKPVRNAGIVCLKCGSPNVVLNKSCTACVDCGSSEGGCYG